MSTTYEYLLQKYGTTLSFHLDPICKKYNQQLKTVEVVIFGSVPMRCAECDEHETKSLKRR